jgi:hypothetical protein
MCRPKRAQRCFGIQKDVVPEQRCARFGLRGYLFAGVAFLQRENFAGFLRRNLPIEKLELGLKSYRQKVFTNQGQACATLFNSSSRQNSILGNVMSSKSHGLRSEHLREDAYWAEIDQILLSNLRETLQLQREAEACAAAGRREEREKAEVREGFETLTY